MLMAPVALRQDFGRSRLREWYIVDVGSESTTTVASVLLRSQTVVARRAQLLPRADQLLVRCLVVSRLHVSRRTI